MINALRGRTRNAPWWLPVLQMAEAWGATPEEVVTMRRGRFWAARWAAYHNELGAIRQEAAEAARKRR